MARDGLGSFGLDSELADESSAAVAAEMTVLRLIIEEEVLPGSLPPVFATFHDDGHLRCRQPKPGNLVFETA